MSVPLRGDYPGGPNRSAILLTILGLPVRRFVVSASGNVVAMALTVSVTGPTGQIGILDAAPGLPNTELMATQSIAGVSIPDTPLVRDVTDFIRDAEDDLLFDHSRRVFLFGALQGRRLGLKPDLELLYVGAMFHDMGLTPRYRSSMLRFEVDGANAARDFLLERGFDDASAQKVWLGIALHTTPGVPEFLDPEIALVTAGVETDVLGIGRDDLSEQALTAVTAAHPRPHFKRRILEAFYVRQISGSIIGL